MGAATPSFKTYGFACMRRQVSKKQAFRVHGSIIFSTGRGAFFPAAKSCTRFDAEGRQFLIDILWWETDMGMDRSFRVPETLFYVCGKSEKIRRSGGVRSGGLKKWWFRVHEKLCFEELNVSHGREHSFLDSFGQIFPTGQKLHAF